VFSQDLLKGHDQPQCNAYVCLRFCYVVGQRQPFSWSRKWRQLLRKVTENVNKARVALWSDQAPLIEIFKYVCYLKKCVIWPRRVISQAMCCLSNVYCQCTCAIIERHARVTHTFCRKVHLFGLINGTKRCVIERRAFLTHYRAPYNIPW
jgi:hypothetical protein